MSKHKQTQATEIPKAVKDAVYVRDGGRCVWCGRSGGYVFPEAHFIPRSKGGLGIPENILTLCRECHDKYDHGVRLMREGMREFFADYLKAHYPGWDESKLYYHKEGL